MLVHSCRQRPSNIAWCVIWMYNIYKTQWLIEGWFNKNTGNLHNWIPLMSTVWNIFLGTNNKILVSTNWWVQKMKGRSFCMTDRLVSGKKGVYSFIKSLQHWQCSPSCSWRLICLPTGVIRHLNLMKFHSYLYQAMFRKTNFQLMTRYVYISGNRFK